MSGAGWRRRALAAAVFGTAGGLSLSVTFGLVRWFFLGGADGTAAGDPERILGLVYSVLLVAVLPAAGVGWLRANTFGAPTPPGQADWYPDVFRGLGVTVRAFVVGCALFAVAEVHDVSALRDEPWNLVVLEFAQHFVFVALLGAVFVGPVALVLGGAAGWFVGCVLGTPTPPAG